MYELGDNPNTWPKLSILPEDIHPDTIDLNQYDGRQPMRGAYDLVNGIPASYRVRPAQLDAGRLEALKDLSESQTRVAEAIHTLHSPVQLLVQVTNVYSDRKAIFGINVSRKNTIYDEIYSNKRLTKRNVRHWDNRVVRKVQKGKKKIVMQLCNGNEVVADYDKIEMKMAGTSELYRAAPREKGGKVIEPLVLKLVVTEVESIDETECRDVERAFND